ncbi:MAG: mechanosensitive ion channel domain-containing protein [Halobacteriota archaeon]
MFFKGLFKSVAFGIIIFVYCPFRAGDSIGVENITGDLVDIRKFSTWLMEIQEG